MTMLHQFGSQSFHLYACLPFVELGHETMIQLGPVVFWPASKSEKFLTPEAHSSFQIYLESIAQIKAWNIEEKSFVNTIKLAPQQATCVSIANNVPAELKEFVLIDALYLLYFACTFRNLYYGQEVPSFQAFRKMIPASMDFIDVKQNWEGFHIEETNREDTVCIHIIDLEICQGLGKALEAIYQLPATQDDPTIQAYKRLVRSIRYLVDRFFQRFVNLFGKGLSFLKRFLNPKM